MMIKQISIFLENKSGRLTEVVLKSNGFTVNTTEVIAIAVLDRPGSLSEALTVLSKESIGIEYMYAVGKDTNGAVVILRVEDAERAIDILTAQNINVLNSERVYNL